MDRPRPTLLLTRPEAQSARFAARFRARFGADWPVVTSPLTEIRFLEPDIPADIGGVIFTSQNAVAAFSRLTPDRAYRAWCVGQRTAEAAKAAGFDVSIGPGDADGLARHIAGKFDGKKLLYARGVHVARDIADELVSAGIETIPVVVYDQIACPPSDAARRLLGGTRPVLLPLFSPRSAGLAGSAFARARAPLRVASISPAVEEASAGLPADRRVIAARPESEAMLDALGALIGPSDTP